MHCVHGYTTAENLRQQRSRIHLVPAIKALSVWLSSAPPGDAINPAPHVYAPPVTRKRKEVCEQTENLHYRDAMTQINIC